MGTSKKDVYGLSGLRDHPHAYGDKIMLIKLMVMAVGSSPRVWGQVTSKVFKAEISRIIPTRMGTSAVDRCTISGTGDHPHAYGDKELFKGDENYHEGSSPRVWGQGTQVPTINGFSRIIPTRMGTSSSTKVFRCGA